MKNLSLKRETLVELDSTEMTKVVGAAQGITPLIEQITQIIDPPDNTHLCSDSC